ncbi:H-NS histone family protein [Burkholderia sp. PU8-34]
MTKTTIQALQQQLGHVNMLLDDAKRKEKAAVLAAIREQVKEYGITELELLKAGGFVKESPKKLPAKYYDSSSGKSWSGRGALPKWLIGKDLDVYLIDKPMQQAKPWWPGES